MSFPYADRFPINRRLPEHGRDPSEVLAELRTMATEENGTWETGRVSGTMYCGDHDHYAFMNEAFGLFAHTNILQRDLCPSATKMEAEVIAMALDLFHAGAVTDGEPAGLMTTGGTGSIMHAVLAMREMAARDRGVSRPNFVMPETGHPAFGKACHLFGIEVRKAPVHPDTTQVDVAWVDAHVDDQTIGIMGSACNYGYGTVDPITELSDVALRNGVGLHVDACLGGFILPFGQMLGLDIPLFDFRVPGVTSISADTHKYGYALKGTSTLMYRTKALRAHQWFTYPDWPGGLYLSPGFAGSRSGGLIASTWASLVLTGREGYLDAAERIHGAAQRMVVGIRNGIPELTVFGDPLFLVAFGSDVVDIYLVNDELKRRGWRMNALQLPPALHFCVTRPNTATEVIDSFLADLAASVAYATEHAGEPAQSGAMYGFGGTPQGNATISALMAGYLDAMHETAPQAP